MIRGATSDRYGHVRLALPCIGLVSVERHVPRVLCYCSVTTIDCFCSIC